MSCILPSLWYFFSAPIPRTKITIAVVSQHIPYSYQMETINRKHEVFSWCCSTSYSLPEDLRSCCLLCSTAGTLKTTISSSTEFSQRIDFPWRLATTDEPETGERWIEQARQMAQSGLVCGDKVKRPNRRSYNTLSFPWTWHCDFLRSSNGYGSLMARWTGQHNWFTEVTVGVEANLKQIAKGMIYFTKQFQTNCRGIRHSQCFHTMLIQM